MVLRKKGAGQSKKSRKRKMRDPYWQGASILAPGDSPGTPVAPLEVECPWGRGLSQAAPDP